MHGFMLENASKLALCMNRIDFAKENSPVCLAEYYRIENCVILQRPSSLLAPG